MKKEMIHAVTFVSLVVMLYQLVIISLKIFGVYA